MTNKPLDIAITHQTTAHLRELVERSQTTAHLKPMVSPAPVAPVSTSTQATPAATTDKK